MSPEPGPPEPAWPIRVTSSKVRPRANFYGAGAAAGGCQTVPSS
jgi:hypothetical protein